MVHVPVNEDLSRNKRKNKMDVIRHHNVLLGYILNSSRGTMPHHRANPLVPHLLTVRVTFIYFNFCIKCICIVVVWHGMAWRAGCLDFKAVATFPTEGSKLLQPATKAFTRTLGALCRVASGCKVVINDQ
jgi:hypothetical protein